jgi:hypothetical protein
MARKSNGNTGFSVNFVFKEPTTNTFRYTEEGEPDTHKIGSLYIKKTVMKEPAKNIAVTVTVK